MDRAAQPTAPAVGVGRHREAGSDSCGLCARGHFRLFRKGTRELSSGALGLGKRGQEQLRGQRAGSRRKTSRKWPYWVCSAQHTRDDPGQQGATPTVLPTPRRVATDDDSVTVTPDSAGHSAVCLGFQKPMRATQGRSHSPPRWPTRPRPGCGGAQRPFLRSRLWSGAGPRDPVRPLCLPSRRPCPLPGAVSSRGPQGPRGPLGSGPRGAALCLLSHTPGLGSSSGPSDRGDACSPSRRCHSALRGTQSQRPPEPPQTPDPQKWHHHTAPTGPTGSISEEPSGCEARSSTVRRVSRAISLLPSQQPCEGRVTLQMGNWGLEALAASSGARE